MGGVLTISQSPLGQTVLAGTVDLFYQPASPRTTSRAFRV